jgi:GNAT superfamily N-acetyltransferase
MNGLRIRDAHPDDRDAILGATLAAYQEYEALMPSHWEEYRQHILATLADVKPAEQIVAEQDGGIVGTVLLYPAGTSLTLDEDSPITRRWPEVRLLAVIPAARGRGVGAALTHECAKRARRAGAGFLTLHTTDMMKAALRLSERMGVARAPEIDFHPVPGVTIKGYRLDLAHAVW